VDQRKRILLIALPVVVVLAIIAVVVAAPWSGNGSPAASSKTTTTTTVPKTTKPDPTVPPGAPTAPLTGLALKNPLVGFRPALAVKIDNVDTGSDHARPQAGIAAADVVFEEIVEGGITRLVPVFQSELPTRVGPIRSARTTDPAMLGQLGRPLLAWSGGNPGVVAAVHGSSLIDVGFDAATPAYSRDRSRRAPHNLFADVNALYRFAPADAKQPNRIFTYRDPGEKLSPLARKVRGVRLNFGGVASVNVTYEYDKVNDSWRRGQNGTTHQDEDGRIIAPRNVVVLVTAYQPSPADARSPEAQTVGTGQAWVFTKGKVVGGTWRRDAADQPYQLTDERGAPIELTPGKTWIELPSAGMAELLR
jgi:Protein of unknown function (DUF3048) N-terminal domain/Protein of unknown function (DUF3048) C-terminal domain